MALSFMRYANRKWVKQINEISGEEADILELAIKHRDKLSTILDVSAEESSESELAAMVSFAIAFPGGFMALVDTYDVKRYFRYVAVIICATHPNYIAYFYFRSMRTHWNCKCKIYIRFAVCVCVCCYKPIHISSCSL